MKRQKRKRERIARADYDKLKRRRRQKEGGKKKAGKVPDIVCRSFTFKSLEARETLRIPMMKADAPLRTAAPTRSYADYRYRVT